MHLAVLIYKEIAGLWRANKATVKYRQRKKKRI